MNTPAIPTLLCDHAKPALLWKRQAITYQELLGQIGGAAAAYPVAPGARIVICSENRPEWIVALYAAWHGGAIVVTVDHMSTPEEIAFILKDVQPSRVFCSSGTAAAVNAALRQAGLLIPVISLDDWRVAPKPLEAVRPADIKQTALILYTSGTTGSPKGVMLSYENLLTNLHGVCDEARIFTPSRGVFALLPFHHILPLVGCIVAPLSIGGTVAMAHSLDPADMIASMKEHRVTILIGVPRLYSLIRKGIMDKVRASRAGRFLFHLARRVDKQPFSRLLFGAVHRRFGGQLRYLVSGGAPLDLEVARDLWTLGFEVMEGFGMTEAAPMISFPRPGRERLGAAGQPTLPGSVRIEEGEILARGPHIMQGYWNRPEETAAALRDGWLYTGDLGYLDHDQYLFITGRKKELIVLPNGKKVNPSEIEEKLMALSEAMSEVGVFFKDNLLCAVVVPNPAKLGQLSPREQYEHIRWQVIDVYNRSASPARKIMNVSLAEKELPKTRLGKLKRHELAAVSGTMAAPSKTTEAAPGSPEFTALVEFLRHELERSSIAPDAHWEMDLGMDSLARVSLMVFLEKSFGMVCEDSVLRDYPTVESLARHIEKNKRQFQAGKGEWAAILDSAIPGDLPHSSWVHIFINLLARVCLRVCFRIRAEGADRLPAGPVIFAPNHQSYVDGLFVSIFLSNAMLRRTYFYAKAKHVKRPWMKRMAQRTNVIVVDIDRDLKQSLQQLAQALRQGGSLIIFPEGTRSPDGALGEFKKTFALLSRELKIPIVPVAISGAFRALPRGGRLPRFLTRIDVRFLPQVIPGAESEDALAGRVRQMIMENLS